MFWFVFFIISKMISQNQDTCFSVACICGIFVTEWFMGLEVEYHLWSANLNRQFASNFFSFEIYKLEHCKMNQILLQSI